MSEPTTKQTRVEMRSWLKRLLLYGLLEKLPRDFDSKTKTVDLARRLVVELSDPNRRNILQTLAEAQAFREWVEDRLRSTRQQILAEVYRKAIDFGNPRAESSNTPTPQSDKPSVPTKLEKPQPPPPHLRVPKEHNPLWDRWLDG